jgi:Tol biopolymer transport system component
LHETIDREARALADGDFKAFSSLQDQSDGLWFQTQIRAFQAWGRPSTNVDSLYMVLESGTLSFNQAWADVRQFRNGQYFRETRFYHQVNGQWLRTQPDLSFWSGQQQSLQTQHFDVSYPSEDNAFIQMVAQRFEAAYDRVCADLDCPGDFAPIRLAISPSAEHPDWSDPDHAIVLPSPRVIGMFDTDDETARRLNDPVTGAAYDSLISRLIQTTLGGITWMSSDPTLGGNFFVSAIFYWEYNRVSSHPDASRLLPPPELITNTQLVQLESLWDMQSTPSNPEQVASSVILFIEQKFGAPSVGRFLRAIAPARSFKQAIEASLGIDEAQFEQQWKDWLRQLPPALTPTPRPPTPIAALNSEGLLLFACTQAHALCLMQSDGADLQQVTPEGQYLWPRWSPAGRVFIALHLPEGPRGGGIGDGGEVVSFSTEGQRLSAYSFGDTDLLGWANPTWSPNGRWLALTVAHDRNGDGLADPDEPLETLIFDRTTLQLAFTPLQGGAFDWPPAWSTDSRRLAFLKVMPSGTQTMLTDQDLRAFLQRDDPWLPTGHLSFEWPVWSPDGSTLAFRVWGQSDEPWPRYFPGMLFTIDAKGKNMRRWPDTDVPNAALQIWSPTSDQLAYTYWIVGDGRYYLNPGTPTPQRRFTYKDCCSGLILVDLQQRSYWDEPGPHSIDLQPVGAWSPDGKWFAAVNASRLVVISLEHPEQHRAFPTVDKIDEVQWQPMPK